MLLALQLNNLLETGGTGPTLPSFSGPKFRMYVVSASGRTRWVGYIPIQLVSIDEAAIGRYDADGGIPAIILSSTSGLTEGVDYIPVVEEGAAPWRYDNDGYKRVVQVADD